jgi:hypothetical protein
LAKRNEPTDGEIKPLPLADLRNHQCKWPMSEDNAQVGGFLFCANPTDDPSPYCARHHRMAIPSGPRGGTGWKRNPKPDIG